WTGSRFIKFSRLNWPLFTAAILRRIRRRSPVQPYSLEITPVGKGSGCKERNLKSKWLTGGSNLQAKPHRFGGPRSTAGRASKHFAERFAPSFCPQPLAKR